MTQTIEDLALRYPFGRCMYQSRNPIVKWVHKRRIEKALKFISPNVGFILDDGCGDGHFIARLQEKKVVGLDLSIIRLKRARKLAREASLVRGDSQNLPFKENSFDCILCCDILEHLPNPDRAVLDLLRVLRPQGRAIISTPNEMIWRIGRLLMLRFPFKLADHLQSISSEYLETIVGTGAKRVEVDGVPFKDFPLNLNRIEVFMRG